MLRRGLALAGLPLLAGVLHAEAPTIIEGSVRVQALSPTLVRLEVRGPNGFEDRETFRILRRDWAGVAGATVVRSGDLVRLQAGEWSVTVPKGAKDLSGVRVVGKDGTALYTPTGKESSRVWLPKPGATPAAWTFADAPRIIPSAQGATPSSTSSPTSEWDLSNGATDLYVFLPGRSYAQLRKDLLRLTGPSEMPPRYMLGLIDSKYYAYTAAEALDRVDQYRKRAIPLDVLTIDTDWRTGGSHGYTPDVKYFPDMPAFIKKAKAKGVRLMFNDHPEPQAPTALDPIEMRYRYAGISDLRTMGLDVWWYDRNWFVGFHEPAPGLRSHLWGMRVYHDAAERQFPNERPVIMGNTDGIDNGIRNDPPDVAAHRFSVQWTGDTTARWSFLRRAVENAVQGGVEGLNPWINDDLGGHNGGNPPADLYIRFMQYGSLCPVMRPHCTKGLERAPWAFGAEAERIVSDAVRMRYRLMPTLYASARESYDTGEPIVRRLDLDYPTHPEAARDDQYLLGHSLLVAPVVDGGPARLPKEWSQGSWKAEYFVGDEPTGEPVVRREEAVPGFDLTNAAIMPGVPVDHFSARWTGTVRNPGTTPMRLLATSDDGIRIWIDGKKVLDQWKPLDNASNEVPFDLLPGKSYNVRIEYQELDGGATMRLSLLSRDTTSKRDLWVPPGTWTDLWTGRQLVGPKTFPITVPIGQIPMFAKAGGLVPTIPQTQRTDEAPWRKVVLEAFAGADGTAMVYEDDGHSTGYRANAFRKTEIALRGEAGRSTVSIAPASGTYPGALAQRAWTVRLHLTPGQTPMGATVDGKPVKWTRLAQSRRAVTPFSSGAASDGDVIEVQVGPTSVSTPIEVTITTR